MVREPKRQDSVSSVKQHDFESQPSEHHITQMKKVENEEGSLGKHLEPMFAGVAAYLQGDKIEIGLSANDATYSIDFTVRHLDGDDFMDKKKRSQAVAEFVVETMREYQNNHLCKFLGVGITEEVMKEVSPQLASRIWAEVDAVPMVFKAGFNYPSPAPGNLRVDEIADSMARKCIMYFGPSYQPRLDVGFQNKVGVDAGGHALLCTLDGFRGTVSEPTWNAVIKYAEGLKGKKIAFFNSTPQGGGVALMRHALVRFLRMLEVDISWYVPKPRPEVFRITKTNHNILQGVNEPDEKLSKEQQDMVSGWIQDNATHYWLVDGGPLASRSKGGADVIFVDDPQMPGLIPLAKQTDPDRMILFRSHIQIRADLAADDNHPAKGVWDYLWNDIQHADLFISHPVDSFVPKNVPEEIVGFMPATTDWLDGLNKTLDPWATGYYLHNYNSECDSRKMARLAYPKRDYMIQVARFDPSKGIPDLVRSYGKLRQHYFKETPVEETPQLVICGHSAIDDPDASRIYDETMAQLEKDYPDLMSDVSVMRLGPIDQTLNALMSQAKVALQLSTREGFEVKVSEALHKGIPIIATKAGGIPLQVQHEKNGFLVEPSDSDAVAKYLHQLFTDDKLYNRMSEYAAKSVSDEVSTVGNALSWLYLATAMSKGEKIKPKKRWINDMAREQAGEPYTKGENRLPRNETT